MDSGKNVKLKINILQFICVTVAAWHQAMQSTTVNCFHLCSYGHELNAENHSDTSTEEEDDAFQEDWIQLGSEKDVNFSS